MRVSRVPGQCRRSNLAGTLRCARKTLILLKEDHCDLGGIAGRSSRDRVGD